MIIIEYIDNSEYIDKKNETKIPIIIIIAIKSIVKVITITKIIMVIRNKIDNYRK